MADDKFKVGDTVKLKSGGPKMTIVSIDEYNSQTKAMCAWFDEGKNSQDLFPLDSLEKW